MSCEKLLLFYFLNKIWQKEEGDYVINLFIEIL